jgi:hypothetical protein
MQLNGQTVLVNPSHDNARQAFPVDQLVLVDAAGEVHHVRLYRGMTAQRLRTDVAKTGVRDLAGATFQCDAADTEHFEALFASAFPGSRVECDYIIEPGEMTLPGRIKFQFSADYFRALAKTALHYYLIHNRRGLTGHEEMFASVKSFIKAGGEKDAFFHASGRTFALPFGRTADGGAILPNCWCHVFAADETREVAVVFMMLFAGPECAPRPTYVTLGRLRTDIILPTAAWGHHFIYVEGAKGGYAGRVVELSLTRLR